MLYIIQDNKIIKQPNSLVVGDTTHSPVSETVLRNNGYKELKKDAMPTIDWYDRVVKSHTQDDDFIYEHYELVAAPNLSITHLQNELDKMNNILENGFSWEGKVVKLSKENQGDYLAGFTMATNAPELFVPMTYTFKNNVKHVMNTS
jgi:hypothetical protein